MTYAETVPVAEVAVSSALTGTVTVVNQDKRMLTIKTPEGRFEVLHVPEEVKRLDEIKVGNTLTITETNLILVDLQKGPEGGSLGVTKDSAVFREPGEKPAGSIVEAMTINGIVESVDKAKSTVTIKGPESTMTFDVRDPAVLESVAPGDGVSASYVRAISGEVTSR
jgi:hypothetical protein